MSVKVVVGETLTHTHTQGILTKYSEFINPSRLNVAFLTLWFKSLDSSRNYKSARNTKLQKEVVVKVTNYHQGIYIVKPSKKHQGIKQKATDNAPFRVLRVEQGCVSR